MTATGVTLGADRLPSLSIGVVIVAFHSSDTIAECITSCLEDSHVQHVVVVDNSRDASTRALVESFPDERTRIEYLDPARNLGFAAGCNLGAGRLESADFIFFVNPDVKLTGALSELRHRAGSDSSVIGGRLTAHTGSLNARVAVTPSRELLKVVLGSVIYSRRYRRIARKSSDAVIDVEQVDGALLGLSQRNWRTLGGFDERFELFYEDVDLCTRARALGPIRFSLAPWGSHVGGASSSRTPRTSYLVNRVSRVRYLLKHFGGGWFRRKEYAFIASVELITRTLARRQEGSSVRAEAVRLQRLERIRPFSVGAILD